MAKLLRAPGGKLLRGPGGKLLTTASLQAMRDCCCGGCDVESCCVAYADCPDTITITVCPWDHAGGGCVSFTISHQGGGIYRSAGDIDYPAVGGKTGKVLRFETQNWGGLVDQFAIRDSDGLTTWITYSSSCGDGRRLIYNGWQGSSASRARWDSGMTCCPCGLPENDLPQTLYIAVALIGGTCTPQPPPVPLHTLTLAQVTPAGAAYMGSSPYSVLYASADTGQLTWSIGYQSLVPYPTGCNANCPPYSVNGWATIVCPDGLQAGYYPLKKGDVLGGQVNFECRDPSTGTLVTYYATYKGTISW